MNDAGTVGIGSVIKTTGVYADVLFEGEVHRIKRIDLVLMSE